MGEGALEEVMGEEALKEVMGGGGTRGCNGRTGHSRR